MTDIYDGGVDTEQILIRMRNDIVLLSSALQSKPASTSDFGLEGKRKWCPDRKQCCKKRPGKKLPPWLVNNVLLFSFLWQCFNVILYRLVFNQAFLYSGLDFDVGLAIMLSFQVIQLLFIIIISVKLTKQMIHHTASNWFLVQGYLSTIMLFAGVYTLLARAAPQSFSGIYPNGGAIAHELVYVRFLYFSTSVMTTCGFGDIVSDQWYTDLVVTFQMLLSMLYTTVIFSKGLSFFSLQPPPPRRKDLVQTNTNPHVQVEEAGETERLLSKEF